MGGTRRKTTIVLAKRRRIELFRPLADGTAQNNSLNRHWPADHIKSISGIIERLPELSRTASPFAAPQDALKFPCLCQWFQ
jgi:hypothetical protein